MNPFPPVGIRRVWSSDYIENRDSALDSISGVMNWTKLGKLVSVNVESMRDFPGVYAFVVNYPTINKLPVELSEVLYIGKSSNVKVRFKEYLSDKKEVFQLAPSKKKIRDNIRVLFSEYKDSIIVYYAESPPDALAAIEDIFIQILDPILNSTQKLSEEHFINYEEAIRATFSDEENAFESEVAQPLTHKDISKLTFSSTLGEPEDAF